MTDWAAVDDLFPPRRMAIAPLPLALLDFPTALGHTAQKLTETLGAMGPVDWSTFTINVTETGHLVASAKAVEPPAYRRSEWQWGRR